MNIIQRNTEHFLKYAELFLNTCWTKFLYTMNIFYTHWTFFQCMVNNIQIHIELFLNTMNSFWMHAEQNFYTWWTFFYTHWTFFQCMVNIFLQYGEQKFHKIWKLVHRIWKKVHEILKVIHRNSKKVHGFQKNSQLCRMLPCVRNTVTLKELVALELFWFFTTGVDTNTQLLLTSVKRPRNQPRHTQ